MYKCSKTAYRTERDAAAMLAQLKRKARYDWRRTEKRYYFCKQCQAYHLTSKPDRFRGDK